MKILRILLGALICCGLWGQGVPSNTNYTTLQWDQGVTVPGACTAPAFFWNTSNTSLYICDNTFHFVLVASGGSGGSLAFQASGTPIGTSATLNILSGLGINCIPTITTGVASLQCAADPAVLLKRVDAQSASNPQLCISASASGTSYTATCATALSAYSAKQTLFWYADVANTAASPVLNIDTLGNKTLVMFDGGTLPTGGIKLGVLYRITYDGTNLRVTEAGLRLWKCVVITGDPGAASSVLANDNDSPVACGNDTGFDVTIATVAAWADAGSPTVTPILTGGTGTSILSGALTAGTAAWAAGTINGTPTLHSFSGTGATCSSTPCTIDSNITTAGGTAKYLVVKIVGTY